MKNNRQEIGDKTFQKKTKGKKSIAIERLEN